jgi:endogenous inhibitor of DNA gyrase (YacG/DUF329 family)
MSPVDFIADCPICGKPAWWRAEQYQPVRCICERCGDTDPVIVFQDALDRMREAG